MPEKKTMLFYKLLFFSIVAGYCLFYAPYGVNETDGGFITGLAWQVLQGKTLYGDVIYVRPPLPVYLRALELLLLPEQWAVMGERCIFFLKVAAYSWLGASMLAGGARRWELSTLGFVVSAHCYPPMAWHTVDGILFSVASLWFLTTKASEKAGWRPVFAALFLFAALLSKQSFYPMIAVFFAVLILGGQKKKMLVSSGTLAVFFALFVGYLEMQGLVSSFLAMTGGSASAGQAVQHGLLDYFRIKPAFALPGLMLLAPAAWLHWKKRHARVVYVVWCAWIALVIASYAFEIGQNRSFTAPFAQSRLMFWAGIGWVVCRMKQTGLSDHTINLCALLAVSWSASVSWGYNMPILFSTPWVYALMQISALPERVSVRVRRGLNLVILLALLAVFRLGYEFVYRDGPRSAMSAHMGDVFPQLKGIYSTEDHRQQYLELRNLARQHPNFAVLPSFPQANYLTRTFPPLPLDWVVRRETGGDSAAVVRAVEQYAPVLFFEKKYLEKMNVDPELTLCRELLQSGTVIGETRYFRTVKRK